MFMPLSTFSRLLARPVPDELVSKEEFDD